MDDASVFDVDLSALIDVLGTNLYTGPGVYVRELLQNAIDAQSQAGRADEPIEITTDGSTFTLADHGTGMTGETISGLLGTIGASSKRDPFGFGSTSQIGQFGVGLLSGFLVGDRIEVSSRADDAVPVVWTGSSTGQVSVRSGDRDRTGTTVSIAARPDAAPWLAPERVRALAADYTAMHPTPVRVNGEQVNGRPGLFGDPSGGRDAARVAFCQDELGFTPLEMFDVDVPEAGLRGVAFVRPSGGDLVARATHRVYVKGLLVGDVPGLVPEWAYFVRLVVDATGLKPTASREGLVHDDLFDAVAVSLGEQVSDWLTGLGSRPVVRERFLNVHEQGVKALAAHRRELLGFVDKHCVFDTNVGPMPLATFRARFDTIRYAGSVDDYRILADILAGRGVGLVNAGHAFETAVIRALVSSDPQMSCEPIGQQFLLSALATPDAELRAEFDAAVHLARRAVSPFDCEVSLRAFEPDAVSALLLTDDSARIAQDRTELLSEASGEPDAWLAALASIDDGDTPPTRPVLVLNATNPLVKRLPELGDDVVAGALVRVVYSQAMLRARRSVRVAAASELDSAITLLADLATRDRLKGTDE
ncbi:molecular chaperone HtpG [Gordonia spumicola]|uniref:Molecular chaperone HtpG n=1 Tax=Gordonia spumicola TaxID=589161 RepID=A0A7I9V8Y3_9ACTN|nr:HSP90 family protein [Gordonia spumicola]GEE01704.1 molecular chaperone HtpG [Gordonia spumicola]